jgi:hypothetical protein
MGNSSYDETPSSPDFSFAGESHGAMVTGITWLWQNRALDVAAVRAEFTRHLQELELRRPLVSITDAAEQGRVRATRAWVSGRVSRMDSAWRLTTLCIPILTIREIAWRRFFSVDT